MKRVLAIGGVRFVLAGVLALALAACFVGRAEAASVFSSSFAAPSAFAQPAASGARVVAGDRSLTLSWSAVKGAAGYRVSWRGRVLKGGKPTAAWSAKWLGLKVLEAPARSYKASGLVNGSEYQLRLESNTTAKKSRWVVKSTLVGSPKAPVPAATVPGAPTGVSGVAGDTSVAVSWLAPSSDGGSAVTGYTVTASGGGSHTCAAATSPCTVTGLTNGTSYGFTVKATNARGDSPASLSSAAVTPLGVPGAPTGVSGVAGDTSVVVSWLAPSSDSGSPITGYTVTASGGGSQTCTTAALSCTVAGLTNGSSYTFTVVATNARGGSVGSVASAEVTPATVPGSPTTVQGVAGDGHVVVSWLAPSSDGGSAVTGYTVSAAGIRSFCTTAALSCSVDGLTNGTSYTFTVKATNARGDSVASAASAAVAVYVVGGTGPGGGTVFYAPGLQFGESFAACGSGCSYLEAAPVDWNSGGSPDPTLQWGGGNGTAGQCSNRTILGASYTAIGSGFANTAAIMAACSFSIGNNSAPAARAASTYAPTVGGVVVNGWFLPSRDELNALDISSVGGLTPSRYWSSSQFDALRAWGQVVGGGGGTDWQWYDRKDDPEPVRPIRAF